MLNFLTGGTNGEEEEEDSKLSLLQADHQKYLHQVGDTDDEQDHLGVFGELINNFKQIFFNLFWCTSDCSRRRRRAFTFSPSFSHRGMKNENFVNLNIQNSDFASSDSESQTGDFYNERSYYYDIQHDREQNEIMNEIQDMAFQHPHISYTEGTTESRIDRWSDEHVSNEK